MRIIHSRTPEMEAFVANTRRAMALTPVLNRLTFDDADEVRALFSELTGRKVGHPVAPSQRRAHLVGKPIVIERNVWIAARATIIAD